MEVDSDEEEMEEVTPDDERECHWIIFFQENDRGVDNDRSFMYDKILDIYMSEE